MHVVKIIDPKCYNNVIPVENQLSNITLCRSPTAHIKLIVALKYVTLNINKNNIPLTNSPIAMFASLEE